MCVARAEAIRREAGFVEAARSQQRMARSRLPHSLADVFLIMVVHMLLTMGYAISTPRDRPLSVLGARGRGMGHHGPPKVLTGADGGSPSFPWRCAHNRRSVFPTCWADGVAPTSLIRGGAHHLLALSLSDSFVAFRTRSGVARAPQRQPVAKARRSRSVVGRSLRLGKSVTAYAATGLLDPAGPLPADVPRSARP